jgi:hypothetical protein
MWKANGDEGEQKERVMKEKEKINYIKIVLKTKETK